MHKNYSWYNAKTYKINWPSTIDQVTLQPLNITFNKSLPLYFTLPQYPLFETTKGVFSVILISNKLLSNHFSVQKVQLVLLNMTRCDTVEASLCHSASQPCFQPSEVRTNIFSHLDRGGGL